MNFPEILLLPILMFSDYILTVTGAIQKEKKYDDHFKTPHYELNPVWQKSISEKRWFNPRHLLLTLIVSIGLTFLVEFGGLPTFLIQGMIGCLFVVYGMIIGRHLSNILVFWLFDKKPDEISGQVVMTHSLLLSISAFQYLIGLIPIFFIVAFVPTPYTIGGLAGACLIFIVHAIWIKKHGRQMNASDQNESRSNGKSDCQ